MNTSYSFLLSPMTEPTVHMFRERYIAVYRPNKKTYTILEWSINGSYWKRHLINPDDIPAISVRVQNIPQAITRLNIKRFNVTVNSLVHCTTTGEYLDYKEHAVAIVKKRGGSPRQFPPSMFAGEFVCTARSDPPATIPPLWTLHVERVLPVEKIQPIPSRIAWIIAEDASKKGESCSITLEEISPITASVTSCFHVFDTIAITHWFELHNTCPMCKQKTVATPAMQETHPTE